MSQCPRRLGKCAFDYEMCLPSAHYKSSDTGFCLSSAVPVPALSQPPWLLQSSSLWLAALAGWSRLELSWLLGDFHNSFGNGHSSNISPANTGLPKGWEMDMGRWFSKQLMKGPMSRLTECIIQGGGEGKICQKSVYSAIRFRVYSPSLADINIVETGLLYGYLAS